MQVEFGLVEQESEHGLPGLTKLGIRSEEGLGRVVLTLTFPNATGASSVKNEEFGIHSAEVPPATLVSVSYYVKPSVARAIGSALMGAAAEL